MREDRPSPSRRRPCVPLVALAASLAVHVALLVLLAPEGDGPPPRTAVVPFTIELRPSPPGSATPVTPPAGPSRRAGPARRSWEVLGFGDVRLPLGRRIWKRVRLVAAN